MAKKLKSPSKLNTKEALAELKTLSESVEFEQEWDKKTPVAELRDLVREGREALAELEDEGEGDGEEDEDDEDLEPEDEDEEEATPDPSKSVDILEGDRKSRSDKRYIRTYSEAIHGEEYEKLAAQFVKNDRKGQRFIVPGSELETLKVIWREEVKVEKGDRKMVNKNKIFAKKEGVDWKDQALRHAGKVSSIPGQKGNGTIVCKY